MNIFLVGGAVRDKILNIEVIERDWVVVGASETELIDNGFKKIGKDFPVFLHPETKEEYALARQERKSGTGHKGFEFKFDSSVTLEEDLLRRDLTINAIAQDENGELIDPHGGLEDINNRLLKRVSIAFEEDPLRVLRVARFAAKLNFLNFEIETETMQLMKKISASGEIETLSKERIWMETNKALSSQNPEIFFSTLQDAGALEKISLLEHLNLAELKQVKEKDLAIKWSVVISGNENLEDINNSFNAPKEYKEISEICDQLRKFNGNQLSPDTLMSLIQKSDLIRKPERFFRAEKAFSYFSETSSLASDHWLTISTLINNIKIDKSLKEGKLIAKKLHEDRLSALNNYLLSL